MKKIMILVLLVLIIPSIHAWHEYYGNDASYGKTKTTINDGMWVGLNNTTSIDSSPDNIITLDFEGDGKKEISFFNGSSLVVYNYLGLKIFNKSFTDLEYNLDYITVNGHDYLVGLFDGGFYSRNLTTVVSYWNFSNTGIINDVPLKCGNFSAGVGCFISMLNGSLRFYPWNASNESSYTDSSNPGFHCGSYNSMLRVIDTDFDGSDEVLCSNGYTLINHDFTNDTNKSVFTASYNSYGTQPGIFASSFYRINSSLYGIAIPYTYLSGSYYYNVLGVYYPNGTMINSWKESLCVKHTASSQGGSGYVQSVDINNDSSDELLWGCYFWNSYPQGGSFEYVINASTGGGYTISILANLMTSSSFLSQLGQIITGDFTGEGVKDDLFITTGRGLYPYKIIDIFNGTTYSINTIATLNINNGDVDIAIDDIDEDGYYDFVGGGGLNTTGIMINLLSHELYLYVNGLFANYSGSYGITVPIICTSNASLYNLSINGSIVSNPCSEMLAANYWNITCNDDSNSTSLFMNISKTVPILNLTIFPGLSIKEGLYGNASCSESHGLPVNMSINGLPAGNIVEGIASSTGSFVFNCSTEGNTNYTSDWISSTVVVGDLCVGDFSNAITVFCVVVLTLIAVSMMILGKKLPINVISYVLFFAALCFVVYYIGNWSSMC